MLLGCLELNVEVSTVAMACIYFERLCMKSLVTKANRKLSIAVSLLLAYKFNEPITSQLTYNARMESLLEFIDSELEISKREVLESEFGAFTKLNFALHVPYLHVILMLNRLLKLVHKNMRMYLGEDMYLAFTKDVSELEQEIENEKDCESQRGMEREVQWVSV